MKFKVLREHIGDKFYRKGDLREANASDVKHLVTKGILAAADEEKSEPPVKNKAEPPVANKAAGKGKSKPANVTQPAGGDQGGKEPDAPAGGDGEPGDKGEDQDQGGGEGNTSGGTSTDGGGQE